MEDDPEGRWELVRRVIELTDSAEPEQSSSAVAADLIRKAGIVTRMHTGMPPEWFTLQTMAEWLLGSYLDIVDTQSWFAIDPWISVATERLDRAQGPLA
jgi:hypothetical protein